MITLDTEIETIFLTAFPAGTKVVETQTYRPGYALYPMRVSVQTPLGDIQRCVIKLGSRREAIEREVGALQALAELGLPVPKVLAGPIELPDETKHESLIVLSEMPGRSLAWLDVDSMAEADLTCRLLIEGVARLHRLTEPMRQHEVGKMLPQITLASELEDTVRQSGAWMQVDLFAQAVERLQSVLPRLETPLVFTNGDYNPLNFLYDGSALTGFIDFEGACFEDPHIGFSKFLIWSYDDYGWGLGKKAGLVERYLYTNNVSRREFAPRHVLRCLRHFIQEVSTEGSKDAVGREFMLRLIADGLEWMP